MKKLKVVKIKKSKWLRGMDGDGTLCTRYDIPARENEEKIRFKAGSGCCLGFACHAHGISWKTMKAKRADMPYELGKIIPGLSLKNEYGDIFGTEFAKDAASINDCEDISDSVRMRKLKALAKKNGFDFQFV